MPLQGTTLAQRRVKCWRCDRLLCILIDFAGYMQMRCIRCHAWTVWRVTEDGQTVSRQMTSLAQRYVPGASLNRCITPGCERALLVSAITRGCIETICKRCKGLNSFGTLVMLRQARAAQEMAADELAEMMQRRWQDDRKAHAKMQAEVAVGLRFNVFRRDGFRCRYCGRSVDDGAVLHADHVIPESKGGPTTLENLVTACRECNIGKSDKDIGGSLVLE